MGSLVFSQSRFVGLCTIGGGAGMLDGKVNNISVDLDEVVEFRWGMAEGAVVAVVSSGWRGGR